MAQQWSHHELGQELSNWGRWGPDDQIGTLNLVTAVVRRHAASLVRTGRLFDLALTVSKDGPQPPGGRRPNPIHQFTLLPSDFAGTADGMFACDDMVIMGLQVATQWDGLAHVGYGGRFYNDVPVSSVDNRRGAARDSFEHAAPRFVSRGVLLDVARLKDTDRLPTSYAVTPQDLTDAEVEQGVQVGSGDVLLVRTGWMQLFHRGDRERFMGDQPGLGLDCARWLRERDVAAVALDNAACEVTPSPVPGARIPFHQVAIRDMGLSLGEMFDLEELAADCATDGRWEFQFCGPGLKVAGAVGGPASPLAIK